MVFQGFSFFAMAIVSMGVLAYHFYKNREAYFNDNPQSYNVYNYTPELEPAPIEDETGIRRRLSERIDTCSICMESVFSSAVSLPRGCPASAISLPCKHLFHYRCVKTWLDMNKTCPNCRAIAAQL